MKPDWRDKNDLLFYGAPILSVEGRYRASAAQSAIGKAGGGDRLGSRQRSGSFHLWECDRRGYMGAELVLKKKRAHPQIFLEIALPFAGHNANEPACQRVQQKADLVHVVGRAKNRRSAFFERNRYMVDHSDLLIAVYCKSHARGGTLATMEYAKKQGIEVIEIPVETLQAG